MKSTQHYIDEYDWALRAFAIEKVRGILDTPDKALCEIYELLTDEQKIAFILAGGMPPSLQHQQKETDSGPQTGELPVLC
jgi:hypothetical protein